ncbi:MAG: hypothetical protein D6705_18200 [Deltaproteobacteria bacterium]|nr:MAG: hypothetical protein D6705_18200 [Deltaproteobacteria bacterium]
MPTLRRVGALVRLLLVLGTPLAVVCAIFGWGLAVGATHRDDVLHWEERLLGWTPEQIVEEEGAHPEAERPPGAKTAREQAPAEPAAPTQDAPAAPAGTPPPPPTASGDDEVNRGAPPESSDGARNPTVPAPPPPAVTPVETNDRAAPSPAPTAAEAAAPDLEAKLALPVVVRVRVFVDETTRAAHPDWIDYVQRLVAAASSIYGEHFGIRFDLVGVDLWPVPADGASARDLFADLEARPREAADIVVGLTDRPLDGGHGAGLGAAPAPDSPFNGAVALVFAHPRSDPKLPHLPVLLHELGHLFGAEDATDPQSDAYRAGSWMAPLDAPRPSRPWIDPMNRRRILERKDRPFAPRRHRKDSSR